MFGKKLYLNAYLMVFMSILFYLNPANFFCMFDDVGSFLFQTVETLSNIAAPELALQLFLQCAEVHGDFGPYI